jgi:hypothetical protein
MESVDKMSAKQIHQLALHEWEALPSEDMQKYVEMVVEDAQRIRREKLSSETPDIPYAKEWPTYSCPPKKHFFSTIIKCSN